MATAIHGFLPFMGRMIGNWENKNEAERKQLWKKKT